VEVGENTSTVVPVSHKKQQKGNPLPKGITGPVSKETANYGYGS
jgi:hypothetical protein